MNKPPGWFTVAAVIALLWNIAGCVAFAMDLAITPEDVAKLPEAQQTLYNSRGTWTVAATGLAVIAGAIGCIGLLLRRKWALPVFVASLAGVLVQDVGMFVLVNGAKLGGAFTVVLQAVVLVVAIALILLSRKAIAHGWLR